MKRKYLLLIFVFLLLFIPINTIFSKYIYSTNLSFGTTKIYKEYNITIDYKGGSGSNPTTYNYTSPDITLNEPTRIGYIFLGYTGSNGTTAQKSVTIAKGETGDKNYVANWEPKKITVYFHPNGGSGTDGQAQIFTYGVSNQSFANKGFSRTGYTQGYWAESSTGSGQYTTNSNVIDGFIEDKYKNTNHRVDLYATWIINQYYVDVNPMIQGTKYNGGKSGFTFSVYLNGTKKATNVTDWSQKVNYGTKVRVVANNVSGYAMENNDVTKTVGTSTVEFIPKWYKYTSVSLKTYNEIYNTPKDASYTFNTATGIYTVTQNAKTPGWGSGTMCDNSGTKTSWGKTCVLHFEIKTSVQKNLRVDPNNCPISGPMVNFGLNDFYTYAIFDFDGSKKTYDMETYGVSGSVTYNGVTYPYKSLKERIINKTLSPNKWYSINLTVPNNASWNKGSLTVRNFSAFGFDCSNDSSNFTYYIRNVYSYNK